MPAHPPLVHSTLDVFGHPYHVVTAGDGPLVLLCHGFPEHWTSWRHQIPALVNGGYRIAAPDMLGYGRSAKPPIVSEYNIVRIVDDLREIARQLDSAQTLVVGHDWGAIAAWHFAMLHPAAVKAVAGLSVPFTPRTSEPVIPLLRALFGDRFNYLLYFQQVGPADAELARDPQRSLARVTPPPTEKWPADGTGMLSETPEHPPIPPWHTGESFGELVDEYARTGFTGGLNWYRNIDLNWELTAELSDATIDQPSLFIGGEHDPAIALTPVDELDRYLRDLRGAHVLPDTGHWVQQERPELTNDLLLAFLSSVSAPK
ncbi:MAG: alpha/beta hydrolase [Actinomycetota bacterium]